jgi:hypothetical protein
LAASLEVRTDRERQSGLARSIRRPRILACPGRGAARSTCEAVRRRAGTVTDTGAW